jgi:chromosome partitioning protein
MAVVALYSMKGGVGKTTTAVNLAWLAARDGLDTLLCDLDPQASASWCFRVRPRRKWSARRFVRGGPRVESAVRGTDYPRLDLLPAALSYRSLDVRLAARGRPARRLAAALAPLAARYRLVLLDCPASLTLGAVAVMRAAQVVLVPVIPAPLAVESYRRLLDFHARKRIGESRVFAFLSMVDRRRRLHRDTLEAVLAGDGVLRTCIPYVSEVEQMSVRRAPLVAFRRGSAASAAFESLWAEVRGLIGEQPQEEPQVGPAAASPL